MAIFNSYFDITRGYMSHEKNHPQVCWPKPPLKSQRWNQSLADPLRWKKHGLLENVSFTVIVVCVFRIQTSIHRKNPLSNRDCNIGTSSINRWIVASFSHHCPITTSIFIRHFPGGQRLTCHVVEATALILAAQKGWLEALFVWVV